MSSKYDAAARALYQVPHEAFVAERRRLAAELKAGGDKLGASRLAKLARPAISAWAVNQLWWQARDAFDALFATAAELRAGKLAASGAHRKTLANLTARAEQLLRASEHGKSEATLRRITMTLAGLAAAGGFEPDQPGTLTKDRDPPGFAAFGVESANEADRTKTDRAEAAAGKRAREAEAAQKKRLAAARAQREAELRELEAALRTAKAELATREHTRERAAKELASAEREVERARAAVEASEARIASLSSQG